MSALMFRSRRRTPAAPHRLPLPGAHRRRGLLRLAAGPAAAALGVVILAGPAAADVTISPNRATQGGAASVAFLVRNERPGTHTTRVEVHLPPDEPVAEVYPMTVPDWAPQIVYRKVERPLPGIHASGLTTATSAVIWTRAPDATPPPPVEELRIELGPLPSVDRFGFTVIQHYSDGIVRRWGAPPGRPARGQDSGTVLLLAPAQASGLPPAPASGHDRHATAPSAPAGQQAPATAPGSPIGGPGRPLPGETAPAVTAPAVVAVGVAVVVLVSLLLGSARGAGPGRRPGQPALPLPSRGNGSVEKTTSMGTSK